MRMRLPELQNDDKEAKKLRLERLSEGWKDIKEVFYYHGLSYIPTVIHSKLISRHHKDLLISHFYIEKTRELKTRRDY